MIGRSRLLHHPLITPVEYQQKRADGDDAAESHEGGAPHPRMLRQDESTVVHQRFELADNIGQAKQKPHGIRQEAGRHQVEVEDESDQLFGGEEPMSVGDSALALAPAQDYEFAEEKVSGDRGRSQSSGDAGAAEEGRGDESPRRRAPPSVPRWDWDESRS